MRPSIASACAVVFVLLTQSALAQDVVAGEATRPKSQQRYTLELADKPAEDAKPGDEKKAEPVVDTKLAAALTGKIRVCYRAEAGKDMTEQDIKLVAEYKEPLVRELAAGFRATGCKANEPATAACLQKFEALTCEELAKAIKTKRWDRHMLQEERDLLGSYTGALVGRRAECRGMRGVEMDPMELQVEADRLGVVITMLISLGQCQLDPKGMPPCKQQLSSMQCSALERANQRNELIKVCPQLLRCTAGPRVE